MCGYGIEGLKKKQMGKFITLNAFQWFPFQIIEQSGQINWNPFPNIPMFATYACININIYLGSSSA